jgi:hypothetical protein
MRRVSVLLALALLLALAGCGGSGHKAVSPLADALGYFPKDAPFVAAVESDPDGPQLKALRSLTGRFPGADVLFFRLQNFARLRFLDFERDIRPQLGAPVVVGLEKPVVGKDLSRAVVVAMRVKHPIRAKQVLLRQPGYRGHGKASGVRIYENTNENRYVAVDGRMIVASANREVLEHALALRRGDTRMRTEDFTADLAGLPSGGLVRVSADPRMMLGADQRFRPALTVKWISALRRMGAVAKASDTGLTLDLRVASDKTVLKDADLPLAPKPESLPLIGTKSEVQVALAQPDRLVRLAVAMWHAMSPVKAAALDKAQPPGVDLERQIPHHLVGPAAFAIDPVTRSFESRSVLIEAGDVRDALTVLAPKLPDLGALFGIKGLGVGSPAPGENFYALANTKGPMAVFGVVGNSLVAASDPSHAAGLASEPTHTAPGDPKGAAVITVDARNLAGNLLAKRLRGAVGLLAPLIASALRDFTGTLTIDRSALRGHFKLTIVK